MTDRRVHDGRNPQITPRPTAQGWINMDGDRCKVPEAAPDNKRMELSTANRDLAVAIDRGRSSSVERSPACASRPPRAPFLQRSSGGAGQVRPRLVPRRRCRPCKHDRQLAYNLRLTRVPSSMSQSHPLAPSIGGRVPIDHHSACSVRISATSSRVDCSPTRCGKRSDPAPAHVTK